MAGTVAWDPYLAGGHGAVDRLSRQDRQVRSRQRAKDHREFYGKGVIITAENAQTYYDSNVKSEPKLDWNDIWGRSTGRSNTLTVLEGLTRGAMTNPSPLFAGRG